VDTVKINTNLPPVAEQVSKQTESARSTSQIQETSQKRSTAGLFITPVIQFDSETLSVIFRVRDGLSGEVKQEYPQQSVIKGRQAVAEATAKQADTTPNVGTSKVQEVAVPTVDASNNGGVQVSLVSSGAEVQSNGNEAGVAASTAGVAKGLGNT
tara:strand:+ start:359 stop:823 length:465 start_codon:yes stop_codon:yes gene_type:complete